MGAAIVGAVGFGTAVSRAAQDDIRDIRGPLPVERSAVGPAAGILAASLLGGAGYLLAVRRRPEDAVPPPPAGVRPEDALEALMLRSGHDPAAFYDGLSALLRNHLEASRAIRASRMTTDELLAALAGQTAGSAGVPPTLAPVLRRADLVRFAGHLPGQEVLERDARTVREFLARP